MNAKSTAIVKAANYYPGPVCNVLYMGSIARCRLYYLLGQGHSYPLTPLETVLATATDAQIDAAYDYVQPYLRAMR